MFSILLFFSDDDLLEEEAPNHEWAEYNLPAAADMDVLREQIGQRPGLEATA